MKMIRFYALIILSISLINATKASIQPHDLLCEYRKNPLGIDEKIPRFCWKITSTERNQLQSAFEIIVSDNYKEIQKQKGGIWKSGKVASNNSLHIEYQGVTLKSFTKYYWIVRVFDGNDVPSNFSEVNSFETSILNQSDWQGKWIGDGRKQFEKDEDFYQNDQMPLFKRQINISKNITSARLYISGLGYYEAFLNNQKISTNVLDPGFTAYGKQVQYSSYEIETLLKKGNNTLGIMLGNGWFNPLPLRLFSRFNLREHQETGRPCLLAQLLITYDDGSKETIKTDESWQTTKGPVVKNSVYLGEEYDARLERNFDENIGWENAVFVKPPSGKIVAQRQPPIRITKILKPLNIKEIGKDTFIVDFGQNFAGVVKIKVQGKAGTKINIKYGEDVFVDGRLNGLTTTAGHIKEIWNLNGGPGSPKTAWQIDSYTLKGNGVEVWNPRFTFHGFRYVEITGWSGKPIISDIEGLRMNSDLENVGNFSCSNLMFNKLHEAIQWTFLSNVFSVQSDCPGREKMGYGGDMVATADAFSYNYDMSQFYSKTIQDFANDQQPDGGITEIVPFTGIADRGYGGQSGPLGWQLAFPFLQKKLYEYYGDIRIIEKNYPNFKKQISFLESKAIYGLFYWDISDHEALDPRPEAFSAACFYYHHVLLAEEFAKILHQKEDEKKYQNLAIQIKNSIIKKYHVNNTGRFDLATQSSQIFALFYYLMPENQEVMKVLEAEFARHNNHISTGIFASKMMFDVLRNREKSNLAYQIANQKTYPGWGFMMDNDATTLWESWKKPDNATSLNHPMFGSIDEWFYRSILGINGIESGFKKIQIKPQNINDLKFATGAYKSISGSITVTWKKETNNFEISIGIPANTRAEVWIPSDENDKIVEISDSTLKKVKFNAGYSLFEIGSGNYQFIVTKTP